MSSRMSQSCTLFEKARLKTESRTANPMMRASTGFNKWSTGGVFKRNAGVLCDPLKHNSSEREENGDANNILKRRLKWPCRESGIKAEVLGNHRNSCSNNAGNVNRDN